MVVYDIPLVYRGGGPGEERVADDGKRCGPLGHAVDVMLLFIYTFGIQRRGSGGGEGGGASPDSPQNWPKK